MYPCGFGYFPNDDKNRGYVMEVVRHINGTFIHIGYVNKKFVRKEDACNYYGKRFPHMSMINLHHSLKSDTDRKTNIAYIIREDYGVECNIPSF